MLFVGGSANGKLVKVEESVEKMQVHVADRPRYLEPFGYMGNFPNVVRPEITIQSYRKVRFNTSDGVITIMGLEGMSSYQLLSKLIDNYSNINNEYRWR
jgi:hypothetical protein